MHQAEQGRDHVCRGPPEPKGFARRSAPEQVKRRAQATSHPLLTNWTLPFVGRNSATGLLLVLVLVVALEDVAGLELVEAGVEILELVVEVALRLLRLLLLALLRFRLALVA